MADTAIQSELYRAGIQQSAETEGYLHPIGSKH